MKNVLTIVNYNAGRKQAINSKKLVQKFLLKNCQKFRFINIDEFEHTDLSDYDTVLVMGGDGTVSKVASKLLYTDKILGIIPCGTANLLASNLGFNNNIQRTLNIINKNKINKIDTLKINENFCVLRCGFGYDSDIICKTPQSLKNKFGYFAYFIAGIIFALRLNNKQFEINNNNEILNINASCIIVANAANMYRNAFSVADNSKLDDNFFDIFILKTKNPILFFFEFLKILFGIKKSNDRVEYFKSKQLKIKNNWIACHIDGEKYKLKNDITVDLIPKSLKVFSS